MDIVCDEQQNIQILFLQTSEMRSTLFCFMTVDGNHSGHTVFQKY